MFLESPTLFLEIPTILWLVALVVFAIVEASCPCLLSIWFCAGSLTAAIAAELGAELWLQVLLFVVVSVALLACLRPWVRKFVKPHMVATNADSLIGEEAIVLHSIDNVAAQGQAKINGMEWSARSSSGQPIPEGAKVRIDRIEGVKLFVTPVEVPAGK